MFLERCCPICRRPSSAVCADCWARLDAAPTRWLASPSPGTEHDLEVRSLFAYSDQAAAMILAAKNGGGRHLLRQLAQEMSGLVTDQAVHAVTWVPATMANKRDRGFDQGRLLARTLAAVLGVPARACLVRPEGVGQKGKGRDERLSGARLGACRPVAGRILLVDDVITTGASLRHGADALYRAGAFSVVAVTAASADRR